MSEDFEKRCIPFTEAQWTRLKEERARHVRTSRKRERALRRDGRTPGGIDERPQG